MESTLLYEFLPQIFSVLTFHLSMPYIEQKINHKIVLVILYLTNLNHPQ